MNKELEQEVIKFANKVIEFVRSTYDSKFTCDVKVSWDSRRKTSWGGKNSAGKKYISIAIHRYTYLDKVGDFWHFQEYKTVAQYRDTCEFYATNPLLVFKAIICHEVAHAYIAHIYKNRKTAGIRPHGPEWREIYAKLREQFVNMYIDLTLKPNPEDKESYFDTHGKEQLTKALGKTWVDVYANKFFYMDNKRYKVIGYNTRARKYPYIIETETGRQHVCPPSVINIMTPQFKV